MELPTWMALFNIYAPCVKVKVMDEGLYTFQLEYPNSMMVSMVLLQVYSSFSYITVILLHNEILILAQ